MTIRHQLSTRLTVLAGLSCALALGACSGNSNSGTGHGGSLGGGGMPGGSTATPATGGTLPTGGSIQAFGGSTGGTKATGGSTTSGGSPAIGGFAATGGSRPTGGTTASGGTIATGGTTGTGGRGGGTTANGGSTVAGGTTAGGGNTGGSKGGTTSTGGATASGGSPATGDGGLLAADTASFHCFNWADPGDNFQTGVVQPTGLSSSDSYATVLAKSNAILSQFQTVLGANSIRIPINEATVNTAWWTAYKGIFDAAISQNMKVIVAYWLPPGSNHIANMTAWNAMWKVVVDAYASSDLIYFDVFNEPSGYSATDFISLVKQWMAANPSVPANRVIVAGTTTDIDVNQQGAALPGCLLSVHIYGTGATEAAALTTHVGPYYNRTIVTEYGGDPGFMQGLTTQMKAWRMGSCFWAALEGSNTYSVCTLNGTAPNYTLTVNPTNQLTVVQSGWSQ